MNPMPQSRVLLLATACTLAVLLSSRLASAQPPPGGPGFGGPGFGGPGFGGPGFGGPGFGGPGFGGPGGPASGQSASTLLTLAQDGAVWDEIKITDEQLGKVTRIRSSVDKQSRRMRDEIRAQMMTLAGAQGTNGQPVDPAEAAAARQAAQETMRQTMAENTSELQEQTDAALKKTLKAAQFTRLQQIDLQQQGPLVVVRPDVARALNLSADQVDRAKLAITQMTDQGREEFQKSQREMFESFQNRNNNNNTASNSQPPSDADRETMREQFQVQMQTQMEKMRTSALGRREKAVQQVTQVLTKAQRAKFNSMLGPPFDLSLLNDGRGPMIPGVPPAPPGTPATGGGGSPGTATPTNAATAKNAGASSAKVPTTTKGAVKK
jgi:hypothetical protein